LFFYCPTFGWIGVVPQSFFDPPLLSPASLFNGFLNKEIYIIIDIVLLLCTICIILGIKAKFSTLLFCILSVFAASFQYSFGKIDHFILIYASLFILSFSGWGSNLALLPDKGEKNDAVSKATSVIAVIICFAFFTAGQAKATHWINFNFDETGTGAWYYHGYYELGNHYLIAPYLRHQPFWFFKIMDFSAVVFELSAMLFLFYSYKSWRLYLLIAIVFHLIILLTLNISFISECAVYLVFVDYSALHPRIIKCLKLTIAKAIVFIVLITAVCIRVFYVFHLIHYTTLFVSDTGILQSLIVGIFVFIVTGIVLFQSLYTKTR